MGQKQGQRFLEELPRIDTDLPISPDLLERLFRQTSDSSTTSLEDVATTLEKDQGLTAKVLAMANSAFYGLQSQVKSVARAVTVLGLDEIRNIVLALGVRELSRKRPCPPSFDMEAYWRHQLAVAATVKVLARRTESLSPCNLFTSGMLHDLGKVIVAMHRPEDWLAIESLRRKKDLTCRQAEEEHWGLDHGLIGALVLKSWDLPEELAEPVSWHHAPSAAPDFHDEAAILALADSLAHHIEDVESPEARTLPGRAEASDLDQEDLLACADKALAQGDIETFVKQLL